MKSIFKVLGFVALASMMTGCADHNWWGWWGPNRGVQNGVVVGQYTSDSVITSKIKTKYMNYASLRPYGISVSTSQGVVTLAGKLPNERLKTKAIRIALNTDGVRKVDARNLVTARMMTIKRPKALKIKPATDTMSSTQE